MPTSTPKPWISTRLLVYLVIWALATAAGSILHWGAWIAPALNPPIPTFLGHGIFTHLANVMTIPATPGWAITMVTSGKYASHTISSTIVSNGIGWAVCLWLLWVIHRMRDRLAGAERPAPSPSVSAASPAPAPTPAPHSAPVVGLGGGAASPPNLARRRFLVDSAFIGAAVGGGATGVAATAITPWDLQVVRLRFPVKGLPEGLSGLRLLQIADTHLGPRVPPEYLHSAMARAIALNPDIYILNGDYVHNGFYQIAPAAKLFADHLLARTGSAPVVGVLGNHDWYAGGRVMRDELTRIGVRMLDNTRLFLDARTRTLSPSPGAVGECLCLAGLGEVNEDETDVKQALGGVDPGIPRIVVAHNPDSAEHPALAAPLDGLPGPPRIDLMLSGHTHGGQVRLPLIGSPIVPSRFGQKYLQGLAQGPTCPVFISAGVGLSIIPVRFNVPPELVEITLVRAT